MDYWATDIALDICLKTFVQVKGELKGVRARLTLDKVEPPSSGEASIFFWKGESGAFGRLEVEIQEERGEEDSLAVRMSGVLEAYEGNGEMFYTSMSGQEIVKEYKDLKPIVKESIMHYADLSKYRRRQACRILEIRFSIFDNDFKHDKNFEYDVDEDDIAVRAIPYVKALSEIHEKIYTRKV